MIKNLIYLLEQILDKNPISLELRLASPQCQRWQSCLVYGRANPYSDGYIWVGWNDFLMQLPKAHRIGVLVETEIKFQERYSASENKPLFILYQYPLPNRDPIKTYSYWLEIKESTSDD